MQKTQTKNQNLLSSQRHKLTVLAVGTPSGAPIVLEKGNYLKDTNNNIVIPQLDLAPLRSVAEALGGQVLPVQYDDSDLERLVASEEKDKGFQEQEEELTTIAGEKKDLGCLFYCYPW